ncbi:hypothetical protein [Nocardia salmonicida]|uniref:hypothetical protein n=1 Tax=Nocardia salmonicida TaxID=53431 RepID=UPI002E29C9C5|nr:hypothetical protein [Nocardia salmonicida]
MTTMDDYNVRSTDIAVLKRLDPNNVGKWAVVTAPWLTGRSALSFVFDPPYGGHAYQFLTFRDANQYGRWQISPVWPNRDELRGHRPHMIDVLVGDVRVPMICGSNAAEGYATIEDVCGATAKWSVYTSMLLSGRDPSFSV